jgi:hypothetical protein
MKKTLWLSLLLLALIASLVACGGGAPAEPAVQEEASTESAPPEEEAAEVVEETAAPAEGEEVAAEEPAAEEAAPAEGAEAGGDMVAGLPASGTDPDTGLEINPPEVVPGVEFIVRGEIVNANLTPQDSPEFVVLSPSGTRYRIRSQHVNEITYEDGSKPALHEFQRGMLVQATVIQEEDAGATITVHSNDFTLFHSE